MGTSAAFESDSILPPSTRTSQVYDRLRQAILDGTLPAGKHLVTQKLAKQFGVSLTPIRESLQRLAEEKLVDFRPHRGAVVCAPTAEDLLNLFEVRAELERLATSLAHGKLDEKHFASLDRTLEIGCSILADKTRTHRWLEADEKFHEVIIGQCGNDLLIQILDGLRERISLHRRKYFVNEDRIKQSVEEHQLIVDSLRHRTARSSAKAMHDHLSSYRKDPDFQDLLRLS
jgi:DNA-binding GntR family transcriptional regulator